VTVRDDILPACAVRVDIGGRPAGSGFFVAKRLVVTCAHVLERHTLAPAGSQPPVTVVQVTQAGEKALAVEVDHLWADEDLAMLKLRERADHPVALLDATPLSAGQPLHTFAFPAKHPNGMPRELDAEGRAGGPQPRWVLAEGQVQRGMSGGPLLNVATGAVCGVVNRTRDQNQALGGYAIPVGTLFKLAPKLQAANERYHESDPTWLNALDEGQQRAWQRAGSKAAARLAGSRHFVITLGQSGADWKVSALVHPDGEDIEGETVDLNKVRKQVARLFRDWASRPRDRLGKGRYQESDQVALLGEILFSAVCPGRIGDRLLELMGEPQSPRLLVSLRFDDTIDPDLQQLPWEHLCLPRKSESEEARFLAYDSAFGFTRALRAPSAIPPPEPTDGALRVVVAAMPPPEVEDDVQRRVIDRLAQMRFDGLAVREPLRQPDDVDIEDALEEEPHATTVLHYVGYGRYDGKLDYVALGSGAYERVQFASIEQLADALCAGTAPRLVVLQLCEGAAEVPADFSELAPPLLERGIEAVVAFQYPVPAPAARKFNDSLYEGLAAGVPVEIAVQEARAKLRYELREALSPSLFVVSPAERRLIVPSTRTAPPPRTSAIASYA
jgi:hypothetical protein